MAAFRVHAQGFMSSSHLVIQLEQGHFLLKRLLALSLYQFLSEGRDGLDR